MPEIKQLNCFVVCADVGSFSEAAKILYTTQSNVSKMISALEADLKVKLFHRNVRGITLTNQGKKVYETAIEIQHAMYNLTNVSTMAEGEWLRVSMNPSDWFARIFVAFYNENNDKHHHYHLKTASSDEIMRRVADGKDDLGFLNVFEIEKDAVRYHLSHHNLEFVALAPVTAALYLGKMHPASDGSPLTEEMLSHLRFVQMYEDDYSKRSNWELGETFDLKLEQIDVAVITNSDYIVDAMLESSDAASIRGTAGSKMDYDKDGGISINDPSGRATFGYVKRKNEELGDTASKLVAFVKKKIEE